MARPRASVSPLMLMRMLMLMHGNKTHVGVRTLRAWSTTVSAATMVAGRAQTRSRVYSPVIVPLSLLQRALNDAHVRAPPCARQGVSNEPGERAGWVA